MSERQPLPEGLAQLPAGPELAAALATVDRSRLFGADLFTLLRARARLIAHEQAQLLADMLETADTPGDGESLARVRNLNDEFADVQIGFELRWSGVAVSGHLELARDLIERLPMVYQALVAGRIDLPRARAFHHALLLLDDETARAVAARLIGKAATWTAAQLRERLRYHALRADPRLARRRYQASVADRRVYLQDGTDGTAELAGVNLPPHRAAAANDRLHRLAKAAKADGDPRTIAQLRADALLDLIVGRPFHRRPDTDPVSDAADAAARDAGLGDRFTPPDPPPTADPGSADPPDGEGDDPIGVAVLGDVADPAAASAVGGDDPRRCVCGGVQPAFRRGVVDLQVKLSTLMCLDDDPGLIPGFGPVIADIARQVAFDQQANPAWRYSVTDEHGNLLHHGHTRRRPTAGERAFVKARDRTCRAPGCRRKAMICEDDHRVEYARNGPSHRGNLCTLCKRHHRFRHERGFVIHQIATHTVLWEAPNKRLYTVLPDAILILTAEDHEPGPPPGHVREHLPDDEDEHDWVDATIRPG